LPVPQKVAHLKAAPFLTFAIPIVSANHFVNCRTTVPLTLRICSERTEEPVHV
jgi:hypothetical protein